VIGQGDAQQVHIGEDDSVAEKKPVPPEKPSSERSTRQKEERGGKLTKNSRPEAGGEKKYFPYRRRRGRRSKVGNFLEVQETSRGEKGKKGIRRRETPGGGLS